MSTNMSPNNSTNKGEKGNKGNFREAIIVKFLNFVYWLQVWVRALLAFHGKAWAYFGTVIAIGAIEIIFGWRAAIAWYYFIEKRSSTQTAFFFSVVILLATVAFGFTYAVHRKSIHDKIQEEYKDESKKKERGYATARMWGIIAIVVFNDIAGIIFLLYGASPTKAEFADPVTFIYALGASFFCIVPYLASDYLYRLHIAIEEERKTNFGVEITQLKRNTQRKALHQLARDIEKEKSPEEILGPGITHFMHLTADDANGAVNLFDPSLLIQNTQDQPPALPQPNNVRPIRPMNIPPQNWLGSPSEQVQPTYPDLNAVTGQFSIAGDTVFQEQGKAADEDPLASRLPRRNQENLG